MARKEGSLMFLGQTGVSPGTKLPLQTEGTLNTTRDPIPTTTKDDDYDTYVAGKGNWSFDFSGSYDDADAEHDKLFTNIDGGVEEDIFITVGTEVFSGKAFVSSFSIDSGTTSPISFSGSYQGSGDLTKA